MRLVHGTSKRHSQTILKNGIQPRLENKSQWEVASNSKSIYLSNAYAFHYALNASKTVCALVEIETDLIPNAELSLMADEDALEQAWRISKGKIFPFYVGGNNMEERTKWFADNLLISKLCGYDHEWSLKLLGNCSFMGNIPKNAITKIVELDIKTAWWISFFDPTITFANYLYLGDQYRLSQQVLLGNTEKLIEEHPNNSDYISWLEEVVAPHRKIILLMN